MAQEIPRLLIVEDNLGVAEMLHAYFKVLGYDVQAVNWGEDAISACQTSLPELIILDIGLPDIDGFEVAYRLRNDRRTKSIPIIFLTDHLTRSDRLQGLEIGADDYLTKPFDVQELRLRVRNAIKRSQEGTLTSPITNLPEGILVEERLDECIKGKDWAVMMITLVNLDKFQEKYGFVAADDVLRAVNLMIHSAVREVGRFTDFIGHLTSDTILIVTTPDTINQLRARVTIRLQQTLDYFYPLNDRERPLIAQDRLRVEIKQIDSSDGKFSSVEDLKIALAENKLI